MLVLGLNFVAGGNWSSLKQLSVCSGNCGMCLDFGCNPLLSSLAGGQCDLVQSLRSATQAFTSLRDVGQSSSETAEGGGTMIAGRISNEA